MMESISAQSVKNADIISKFKSNVMIIAGDRYAKWDLFYLHLMNRVFFREHEGSEQDDLVLN